jgi:hypothetical protein
VWFAMMIFYGLDTPDKEQVFAQLRRLPIPAPETPSTRLNDLYYRYDRTYARVMCTEGFFNCCTMYSSNKQCLM